MQNDEFIKLSSKDKVGHLPYLYESDMKKIERIRSKLVENTGKHVSRREYFGL